MESPDRNANAGLEANARDPTIVERPDGDATVIDSPGSVRSGELAVGTQFAGYVIEGVAGQGGMGVVYRARQLRPARTVALKVISPAARGRQRVS